MGIIKTWSNERVTDYDLTGNANKTLYRTLIGTGSSTAIGSANYWQHIGSISLTSGLEYYPEIHLAFFMDGSNGLLQFGITSGTGPYTFGASGPNPLFNIPGSNYIEMQAKILNRLGSVYFYANRWSSGVADNIRQQVTGLSISGPQTWFLRGMFGGSPASLQFNAYALEPSGNLLHT